MKIKILFQENIKAKPFSPVLVPSQTTKFILQNFSRATGPSFL